MPKTKGNKMADKSKNDVATKSDLNTLKKELLDSLASKKELKEETAKLSTKASLEVVASEVLRHSGEIAEIKFELKNINVRIDQMQDHFDNKFDIVLRAIDNVASELSNSRSEKAAIDHALIRHDDKLDDHEIRIERLELKRA